MQVKKWAAALGAPWLFCILFGAGSLAVAQSPGVPEVGVLSRLVWTTLVELDSANRTGNYSVFHALCAPAFQEQNPLATLPEKFSKLRSNRVDVGKAVTLEPSFHIPPAIDENGILRLRGGFEFRPRAIRFDLLFQNIAGGWRILAISVAEMPTSQR